MKRITYIIAGIALFSACISKPGFQLKGTVDGLPVGAVVQLEQRIDKEYVQIDSAISMNGTFEFTGSVIIKKNLRGDALHSALEALLP